MGDRSDISLPLSRSRFCAQYIALCVVAILIGCVDFAEPKIPDRRAPAILQANVRIFDIGVLQIDGSLSPGRDSLGFQRAVLSPYIQVNQFLVEPTAVSEQGVRTYFTTIAVPRNATLGPFEITLPEVQDVGQLPMVRWHGLRKLDPDTLRLPRGQDLVLRMDTALAPSDPPNRNRQWFIDIRAGIGSFRVSGDGAPPLTLRIPSEWIPASTDNRANVSMIYFQTAQLRTPAGTYIANMTLDTRIQWNIQFQ